MLLYNVISLAFLLLVVLLLLLLLLLLLFLFFFSFFFSFLFSPKNLLVVLSRICAVDSTYPARQLLTNCCLLLLLLLVILYGNSFGRTMLYMCIEYYI